jgi:amidase
MTPVVSTPPFPTGRWEGRGWVWTLTGNAPVIPFTSVWNQTGQPAASVPAGFTRDGLPLAVQLVGRPGDEATLLSLASQLERERRWTERRPPVS